MLFRSAFPQYKYPNAKWRYAQIADYLNLGGKNEEEKVEKLISEIAKLKAKIDIPRSIQACGISEAKFYESLETMAMEAFDDQCTGANPRYPLIEELKALYVENYHTKA